MKLREYLDAIGKRPSQFAEDIGVATNTVLRWLNGTRTPNPDQMRVVFDATKGTVRPDDFVLEGR